MRFLPCGDDALLVDLADADEAIALARSLAARPVPGVVDAVPGARTVLLQLARTADRDSVRRDVAAREGERGASDEDEAVEIGVVYDGEDLAEVADLTGLTPAQVIERHAAAEYAVAFTGFAPGFAYLSGLDPALHVPRRSTPRTRIPAGSVAIAGEFAGVYPSDSPGGWRLLGRALDQMWSLDRDPPALLRPGMRVRFVPVAAEGAARPGTSSGHAADSVRAAARIDAEPNAPEAGGAGRPIGAYEDASASGATGGRSAHSLTSRNQLAAADALVRELRPALEVLAVGPHALLEDLGRPGKAELGVSPSGAMDRTALRRANAFVGGDPGCPTIETALGGLRLRARGHVTLAVTGAPVPLTIIRSVPDGEAQPAVQERPAPFDAPFALAAGEEVIVGAPERGVYSYVAARGGFDAEPVLGSASRDVLAGLGPAPFVPGAVLPIGSRIAGAVEPWAGHPDPLPAPGETLWLDVVPGPRDDWFTPESLELLADQDWLVSPRSNRAGLRLEGERPLERAGGGELPSEGTVTGALQVPPDGQPILFAADRPLTGGYPVVGVVARAHLSRAAQAPPGTRIRFRMM
ncbi:5-oxoprolinase subunit B/C family protein [Microbacterium halophytorum]|uniref:5-oxoprolinase subunit B/C family protein n=1 Tax=Microbacterium halophytorum TaxID=2067568 RepID=UPI000CFDD6FE|nr:urea amidolyase family protein [Microbacterium halophytorum]